MASVPGIATVYSTCTNHSTACGDTCNSAYFTHMNAAYARLGTSVCGNSYPAIGCGRSVSVHYKCGNRNDTIKVKITDHDGAPCAAHLYDCSGPENSGGVYYNYLI